MRCMHENKINKIYECNLLHDILNPSIQTKHFKSNYSPILHGYMNTQKGRTKFNIFQT